MPPLPGLDGREVYIRCGAWAGPIGLPDRPSRRRAPDRRPCIRAFSRKPDVRRLMLLAKPQPQNPEGFCHSAYTRAAAMSAAGTPRTYSSSTVDSLAAPLANHANLLSHHHTIRQPVAVGPLPPERAAPGLVKTGLILKKTGLTSPLIGANRIARRPRAPVANTSRPLRHWFNVAFRRRASPNFRERRFTKEPSRATELLAPTAGQHSPSCA